VGNAAGNRDCCDGTSTASLALVGIAGELDDGIRFVVADWHRRPLEVRVGRWIGLGDDIGGLEAHAHCYALVELGGEHGVDDHGVLDPTCPLPDALQAGVLGVLLLAGDHLGHVGLGSLVGLLLRVGVTAGHRVGAGLDPARRARARAGISGLGGTSVAHGDHEGRDQRVTHDVLRKDGVFDQKLVKPLSRSDSLVDCGGICKY